MLWKKACANICESEIRRVFAPGSVAVSRLCFARWNTAARSAIPATGPHSAGLRPFDNKSIPAPSNPQVGPSASPDPAREASMTGILRAASASARGFWRNLSTAHGLDNKAVETSPQRGPHKGAIIAKRHFQDRNSGWRAPGSWRDRRAQPDPDMVFRAPADRTQWSERKWKGCLYGPCARNGRCGLHRSRRQRRPDCARRLRRRPGWRREYSQGRRPAAGLDCAWPP